MHNYNYHDCHLPARIAGIDALLVWYFILMLIFLIVAVAFTVMIYKV